MTFIGNRANQLLLETSVRRGTLPHAYLFSGPEGVGKRTLAIRMAKALNCLGEVSGIEPCGTCRSCHKADTGSHPDILLLEPDGNVFKVDQVRELIGEIAFRPFEGRRRVFVLDGSDRMNEAAANCLLKTLEEPPPDSLLILISSNAFALLPTIVSRVQTLKFQPVGEHEIEAFLEERGSSAMQARQAARLSGGSVAAALSFDPAVFEKTREAGFTLFALMCRNDDAGLFEFLSGVPKLEGGIEALLKIGVSILRDLVIMNDFQDAEAALHRDRIAELSELQGFFPRDIAAGLLQDVESFFRKQRYNLRPEPLLQDIVLRNRAAILRGKSARASVR